MPKLPFPPPPKLNPAPKRPGEGNGKTSPLDTAAEAGISAVDWIDERTQLSGAARWLMYRKVPKGTNWFYTLGTATMFAFLNQAVTGVFLAMYYDPSPTRAYESARYITNEAFLGEFVRGMHKWGSSVMVILIFLHMARTFFFGAYKYPRELNWVIGVVLVILTFVMALTGYLLPFDQRSLWATVVANNITASGPLVGPYLGDFLRAGPEFGATTLSRFYSIHMLLVPGRSPRSSGRTCTSWPSSGPRRRRGCAPRSTRSSSRSARDSASLLGRRCRRAPRRVLAMNKVEKEAYLREYSVLKAQGKPFFPYAVAKDGLMACVVMLAIILLSLTLGAELGPKADPTTTTYTPRPEWYFFFLFELLRVIKPPSLVALATIGIPTICMILLFLLPFYDRGPERRPERRPIATTAGIFVIAAMGYLTYLGAAAGPPTQIDEPTPARIKAMGPEMLAKYEKGKQVVAQSGCLACHKIGENGNSGPGPPLTEIGSRLPSQAIARTLVNPTAPMPSFVGLQKTSPDKFDALVTYVSQLKG